MWRSIRTQLVRRFDWIFLGILLLVGMAATFSYGACMDTLSEQQILYANSKEYMLHLPGFGKVLSEYDEQGIIEISQNMEKDHGIAAYYPLFWIWHVEKYSTRAAVLIWNIYTYLLVFLGTFSLYQLGKMIWGRRTACLTTLLFFLTPRMFAESHYNNKDMVLLAFCFIVFWLGARVLREARLKTVIPFAFAGAILFNLKVIGGCILGLLWLCILIQKFTEKSADWRKVFWGIFLWLGFFFFITPACWGNIVGYFVYLWENANNFSRWGSYILYNGKQIHKVYTGIPHKYLPTLILLTTPPGILLLSFAGYIWPAIWGRVCRKFPLGRWTAYTFCMLGCGLIPLSYAVIRAVNVYNGWRHFYFVYASVMVGAGTGIFLLEKYLTGRTASLIRNCVLGGYIGILAVMLAWNHPQQQSYFNFLAGSDVEHKFETDYWCISSWEAFNVILADAGEAPRLVIGGLGAHTRWGLDDNYRLLANADKARITLKETWEGCDYVVVNTTYTALYYRKDYEAMLASGKMELIRRITSYGNVICEVYAAKR